MEKIDQKVERVRIFKDNTGDIAYLTAKFRYMSHSDLKKLLLLADAIEQAKGDMIGKELNENQNFSNFVTNLLSLLRDFVCKVCNGEGEVGQREKVSCARCEGNGWVIPKD